MLRNLPLFCCLIFLVFCNCQKSVNTKGSSKASTISNEKIKVFLREKNYDIVSSANLVIAYDIKKILIEGTDNEYSNKVVLKDTLDKEKVEKLIAFLKDDASYMWNDKDNHVGFNPIRQFLVRNNSKRIILLVNYESDKIGFINLEGLKVVRLSDGFSNFLKDF